MYISGELCYVKAAYMSGLVAGNVNRMNSCTQYKFEFSPLSFLNKKTLLLAEIQRLYFDYKTLDGKKKVVLCYKSEAEYDKDNLDYNLLDSELRYLAQIDGCRQPYIKMFMKRRKENRSLVDITINIGIKPIQVTISEAQFTYNSYEKIKNVGNF